MPEYLAPGVYIEEIEIGGKPIEGVSTSTAGFLGETERGPVEPRLVTSFEAYRRLYGEYIANSYLPYSVDGFFANGGKRCFISRIVGKDSTTAVLEKKKEPESTPGMPGPSPTVVSFELSDQVLSKLEVQENVPSGVIAKLKGVQEKFEDEEEFLKAVEKKLTKAEFNDNKEKILKHAREEKPGGGGFVPPSSAASASEPQRAPFWVKAIGPGKWGNQVAIKIDEKSEIIPDRFKITVCYWTKASDVKDMSKAAVIETYDTLSNIPTSSDFYEKRINNISSLIEVEKGSDKRPTNLPLTPLTGGGPDDPGALSNSDYKGRSVDLPGGGRQKTGLEAFREIDEISILCAPNENNVQGLTSSLIQQCELMKDRFAILQASQTAGPVGNLFPPFDSKYAAFYYPWIKMIDPITNMPKLIPPGGHMAGIYARSDTERGVHKAPANEVVRGAIELQFPITTGDQDLLNPRGVNCIRSFVGRGIRVWGARTVSSDPIWKYVNVRRLFLYLEESIEEGTQWVVFEPNDHRLWARVKQSVTDFLTRVWKDGALMGRTPEEAFFVRCDETTMTPDDIDNGRLIVLIGVAPVKPAEFVIFRIAQWRSGSEIIE